MAQREQRLLITGSNGVVGRMLTARLAREGRRLRLLDLDHDPDFVPACAEVLTGSVVDRELVARAVDGVDAVVHLAGIPGEDTWERILEVNVHGSWVLLDAARAAGVPKVLLASSNHAVGMAPTLDAGADLAVDAIAPPDSYYGWSKTAVESLGRLFGARTGLDVLAVRIGSCFPEPNGERALATWMSPDDVARLVEAFLVAAPAGYRCIWGVSDNTRRWWSLEEGRAMGYEPVDDAESYAGSVPALNSVSEWLGGRFPEHPLGEPMGL
ncbi:NAD-dependent epimerase/dehydratase family protein [Kineococcus sp. R86509]|uniref:NAD-dependent epimerase/dehydratase family protein n=1 Tax=Kineococcus sp. R86509 TaxID=3093851 RepID=UPI0036D2867F